jgi:hypothetical protein
VDLNTKRGNVLLFELSCQMAFDERSLKVTHGQSVHGTWSEIDQEGSCVAV